jgi:hypothetical protein
MMPLGGFGLDAELVLDDPSSCIFSDGPSLQLLPVDALPETFGRWLRKVEAAVFLLVFVVSRQDVMPCC